MGYVMKCGRPAAILAIMFVLSCFLHDYGIAKPMSKEETLFEESLKTTDSNKKLELRKQIVEIAPTSPYGYYSKGYLLAINKPPTQSDVIEAFGKALELKPNWADARYSRGLAYFNADEYDKAISDLSRAISLNPKDEAFYFVRGQAYFAKTEYENAASDLSKYLSLHVGAAPAVVYRMRGLAYQNLGQRDKALADFSQSLTLEPSDLEMLNIRGYLYYENSDYLNALKDSAKLIEQAPKSEKGYMLCAAIFDKQDMPKEAAWCFLRALKIKPSPNATLRTRAHAWWISKKPDFDALVKK